MFQQFRLVTSNLKMSIYFQIKENINFLVNHPWGDEEYTTYDLLGDYQSSKNGAFKDIGVNVNFYGQNLKSLSQIPVFEGVQNETAVDYESDASYKVFPPINGDSGEEPNLSLIKLDETILATDIWEFGTQTADDTIPDFTKIISENVGLTKEKSINIKTSKRTNNF